MKDNLKFIVDTYNKNDQVLQSIEEMAELTQALLKNINRGKDNIEDITSEIADVQIMIDQLKLIYDIPEEKLKDQMEYKIQRQVNRINNK